MARYPKATLTIELAEGPVVLEFRMRRLEANYRTTKEAATRRRLGDGLIAIVGRGPRWQVEPDG